MKKRVLCLALSCIMCLSMLPAEVMAAGAADSTPEQEGATRETYDALGLPLKGADDPEVKRLQEPFPKDRPTSMNTAREVYAAVNGASASKYTLRDGFDCMEPVDPASDNPWDHGYAYYNVNADTVGSKADSALSSNSGSNSLQNTSGDFSGLFATSEVFTVSHKNENGEFIPNEIRDGKENYVAELRVYGEDHETNKGSGTYSNGIKGKVEVVFFKINDDGSKTQFAAPYSDFINMSHLDHIVDDGGNRGHRIYLDRWYDWEFENMFDITTGDMDGDGTDEVMVYDASYYDNPTGHRYAYVKVLKYNKDEGSFSELLTLPVTAGMSNRYSKNRTNNVPIVSLSAADMNRDGKDELMVTVSSPQGYSGDRYATAQLIEYCEPTSDYPWNSRTLLTVDLNHPDPDKAEHHFGMNYVNSAVGNFTLPGTSVGTTGIVLAGYQSHYSSANTVVAYRTVYFDPQSGSDGAYKVTPYKSMDLSTSAGQWVTNSGDYTMETDWRPVILPLACGNLYGSTGGADSASQDLFIAGDVYKFDLMNGVGELQKEVSLYKDQCNSAHNYNKGKGFIWIGDVRTGCVDTDAKGAGWRDSFVYPIGVHRLDNSGGSDDYYWTDIGVTTRQTYGDRAVFSSREGVVAESPRYNKTKAGFVSLCLPDIQQDSMLMRYVSQALVYSNPEVYAILQASPYFKDLNEVYSYVNNGGTSFSTSESSGIGAGTSISQTLGTYVSMDCSLFSAGEFEAALTATASYDYNFNKEVEYSIEYNSQAGGDTDHVVVYTVPYVYYQYEAFTPNNAGEWAWRPVVIPVSMSPVHAVLKAEKYDQIARNSGGTLRPVHDLENPDNSILKSIPGQPETYHFGGIDGEQEFITEQNGMTSSDSSSSDTTLSITETRSHEHTITLSTSVSMQNAVGAGFLGNDVLMGVMSETTAGLSTTISSTTGTSFSATVDGLPQEAEGYRFSWKLGVKRTPISKDNSVWVVGYDVFDVGQPLRMPQNFQVQDVRKDAIDLYWEKGDDNAAAYEIYRVMDDGSERPLVRLTAEGGRSSYTYTVDGLIQNTHYAFRIRAVDFKGVASISSNPVEAYTLSGNVKFYFKQQPGNLKVEPNTEATFVVDVLHLVNNSTVAVNYQWEEMQAGTTRWEPMGKDPAYTGQDGPVLTIKKASLSMDGTQYRCKITNQLEPYFAYSEGATLSVGHLTTHPLHYSGMLEGGTFDEKVGTVLCYNVKGDPIATDTSPTEMQDLRLEATSTEAYTILSWTRNGQPVPAEEIRIDADGKQTMVIHGHCQEETIVVNYVAAPTITFSAEADGSVSASVDGKSIVSTAHVPYGSDVVLTAAPGVNKRVKSWTVNGQLREYYGANLVLENVTENQIVSVAFKDHDNMTTVFAGPHGKLTSVKVYSRDYLDQAATGIEFAPDTPVTITATPDEGYEVKAWLVDGEDMGSGNVFQYVVTGTGGAINVVFQPMTYTVTCKDCTMEGYRSGDAIRGGTVVKLTADDKGSSGQAPTGWMVNKQEVPGVDGETLMWTVPEGLPAGTVFTVEPIYGAAVIRVAISSGNGGIVAAPNMNGNQAEVAYGDSLVVTASPNEGYFVKSWTLDGEVVTGDTPDAEVSFDRSTLTLTNVVADKTVVAQFQSIMAERAPLTWTQTNDENLQAPYVVNLEGHDPIFGAPGAVMQLPALNRSGAVGWSANGELYQAGQYIRIDRKLTFVQPVAEDKILYPEAAAGEKSAFKVLANSEVDPVVEQNLFDYNDTNDCPDNWEPAGAEGWIVVKTAFPARLSSVEVRAIAGKLADTVSIQRYSRFGEPSEADYANALVWDTVGTARYDQELRLIIPCDQSVQYNQYFRLSFSARTTVDEQDNRIAQPMAVDGIVLGGCSVLDRVMVRDGASLELMTEADYKANPTMPAENFRIMPKLALLKERPGDARLPYPYSNPSADPGSFSYRYYQDFYGKWNEDLRYDPVSSTGPADVLKDVEISGVVDPGWKIVSIYPGEDLDTWLTFHTDEPTYISRIENPLEFGDPVHRHRFTLKYYAGEGVPSDQELYSDYYQKNWKTIFENQKIQNNEGLEISYEQAQGAHRYYRLYITGYDGETYGDNRYNTLFCYPMRFYGTTTYAPSDMTVTADGAPIQSGKVLPAGTEVKFSLNDITHYYVKEWLVNGKVVPGGKQSCTIITDGKPMSVEVRTIQAGAAAFNVTAGAMTNGTVKLSTDSAVEGGLVGFTAVPTAGYHVKGLPTAVGADMTEIPVTRAEDGSYTFTMPAQAVTVTAEFEQDAARPAAPSGITATIGKISGVTKQMEYQRKGSGTWIPCTDTIITGLTTGSYLIRYKATADLPASLAVEILVADAMFGDIGGNGKIDVPDAMMALQYSIGLITLDGDSVLRGDVDGNGKIDVCDAVLILRHAAGLIKEFPQK